MINLRKKRKRERERKLQTSAAHFLISSIVVSKLNNENTGFSTSFSIFLAKICSFFKNKESVTKIWNLLNTEITSEYDNFLKGRQSTTKEKSYNLSTF